MEMLDRVDTILAEPIQTVLNYFQRIYIAIVGLDFSLHMVFVGHKAYGTTLIC